MRATALVVAVVSFGAVPQSKTETSLHAMASRYDSTMHMNDSVQHEMPTQSRKPNPGEGVKLMFDEDHFLDARTLPFTIGQKESAKVNLGMFSKAQGEFAERPAVFSGTITAGYGSYVSPSVAGSIGTTSRTGDLLFRASYTATKGKLENQDNQFGSAGVSGGVHLPDEAGLFSRGRLGAELGFDIERYKLYGSVTPERQRTVRHLDGVVTMSSPSSEDAFVKSALHVHAMSAGDSTTSREIQAGLEFSGGISFDRTQLSMTANLWKNFQDAPFAGSNPSLVDCGVNVRHRFASVEFVAGTALFLQHGSDGDAKLSLSPRIEVVWRALEGVSLFGTYRPIVERNSLSSLLKCNPYLFGDVRIRHTEYFQNASGGVELEAGRRLKAKVSVHYKRGWNVPIFVDIHNLHRWSVAYFGTTRIVAVESAIYVEAADSSMLGAVSTMQTTRNLDSESALPYTPRVTVRGFYVHRFPFALGFHTDVEYIGQRYADVAATRSVPALVIWDAEANYQLTRHLTLGVGVANILDERPGRWENYPGQARRFTLSVDARW